MSAHSDHEAFLRAALHAAADSLEPRGDGLERIRARVQRPRPVFVTRAQAIGTEVLLRAPAWLQDTIYQIAGVLEEAWKRFAPPPAPGRHRSRAQGWLRPIAAMAVVMGVVAAVTYVAIDASTTVSPSSSNSHSNGGAGHASHHSHSPSPAASHPGATSSLLGGHSSRARTTPLPSTSAAPKKSPSTSPSPAGSPSTIPSPTDTPTGSTTTPTTSPSVATSSTG